MGEEVKHNPGRPRTTRLSRKHQATIPVAVLAEAGVKAGEQLRVEALGPGRIVLTRAEDSFEDLLGAFAGPARARHLGPDLRRAPGRAAPGRWARGGGDGAVRRPGPDRRALGPDRPAGHRASGAARGLKLPDAVIVATGLRLQADVIVTADARWKGIETVKVVDGHR
jgi:bifunctional DNA-binding transcriptional regulator/antitoxin component of YhaV-PrlF toxin-antitoxin module